VRQVPGRPVTSRRTVEGRNAKRAMPLNLRALPQLYLGTGIHPGSPLLFALSASSQRRLFFIASTSDAALDARKCKKTKAYGLRPTRYHPKTRQSETASSPSRHAR